jgi:multidrug efflux system outer membrane protein
MKRYLFLLLIVVAFFAAGCTMIPKYHRPEAPVPDKWPSGPAYKQAPQKARAVSEIPWRQFFTDERIQTVIASALENNRDLRVAALNVERARALYRIQRAELLPAIDASASGSRERKPAALSNSGSPQTTDLYRADLGISYWEIDFFGRIRSLEKSALEQYFATEQARRSAQILLVSEVANAYLTLAADREDLQLA